jgi:hypothetical protein
MPPDQKSLVQFKSLVLSEPLVVAPELEKVEFRTVSCAIANARRVTWKSREDAYASMKRSKAYGQWHDDVLKKFTVRHQLPWHT